MNHWTFLMLAILCEVAGTTSMKLSVGLTKLYPSIAIFVFYAGAFAFNALATRTLDMSVAYAIWAGIGTALTALIGIYYFKEPTSVLKYASVGLIVIGVIGLHTSTRLDRDKPKVNDEPPVIGQSQKLTS
jgi:small multidrug resistance pump